MGQERSCHLCGRIGAPLVRRGSDAGRPRLPGPAAHDRQSTDLSGRTASRRLDGATHRHAGRDGHCSPRVPERAAGDVGQCRSWLDPGLERTGLGLCGGGPRPGGGSRGPPVGRCVFRSRRPAGRLANDVRSNLSWPLHRLGQGTLDLFLETCHASHLAIGPVGGGPGRRRLLRPETVPIPRRRPRPRPGGPGRRTVAAGRPGHPLQQRRRLLPARRHRRRKHTRRSDLPGAGRQ